jgi:phosphoribosyl 1,2-cyclic phosphodiesterase
MITFTSLASGSSGNAYLVQSDAHGGTAPLLIECGLPLKNLRAKILENNASIFGLAGCIVSHAHKDHSRAIHDLLRAGINCYSSWEAGEQMGISKHHRYIALFPDTSRAIGRWFVKPFWLKHDSPCMGFFIGDIHGQGKETLLFIPDTCYVRHKFQGINILAVECNHVEEILSDNILSGKTSKVVGRRIRRNHMSLETLIAMLRANDLSQCRAIHLLHLSNANSDEQRMIQAVQEATGVAVYAE